tara:strand:- start:3763 stop:4800 length:1038 start_codon:yes stop_codon:yes gene_type:complete
MNSLNTKLNKKNKLLNILSSIDISKITKTEINHFKNKKILITGVSGIIGINLLFFFDTIIKKKKIQIFIDGTFNTSLFQFVKNYFKNNKRAYFRKIDLSKKKIDKKKKYDYIFHCAGYGQPSKFLRYSEATFKLNSATISSLKDNLKKNGKFIYMSTTEIYSGNNKLCDEKSTGYTSTFHPRSPYIDSKKFGESYIINTLNNFLIYRVCLTYGPGAKLNDERILNLLLIRAIKNRHIDIYGGFNQLRSNLYIGDAIKMIIKSTVKYKNQIFNINNHKMTTLGQMVKIISKLSKKKIRKQKSFLKGAPSIIKISNKKILNSTNYKISTKLEDGLMKTYQWYLNLIS